MVTILLRVWLIVRLLTIVLKLVGESIAIVRRRRLSIVLSAGILPKMVVVSFLRMVPLSLL